MVNALTLYIFCHRHNKGDTFLRELKQRVAASGNYISFEAIRPVLYNYSKKAQRKLMANRLLAFLMYNFVSSAEALAFIKAKAVSNGAFNGLKHAKILQEVEEFKQQARASLQGAEGPHAALKALLDH